MLHHRNDVNKRAFVARFVRFLKGIDGEISILRELLPQLSEGVDAPNPRVDREEYEMPRSALGSPARTARTLEIVLGLELFAGRARKTWHGLYRVLGVGCHIKCPLWPLVRDEQFLKTSDLAGSSSPHEVAAQHHGQTASEFCKVAVRHISGKVRSRFSCHLLVDAVKAFNQTADVVLTVTVTPNVFYDLADRARGGVGASAVMPVAFLK